MNATEGIMTAGILFCLALLPIILNHQVREAFFMLLAETWCMVRGVPVKPTPPPIEDVVEAARTAERRERFQQMREWDRQFRALDPPPPPPSPAPPCNCCPSHKKTWDGLSVATFHEDGCRSLDRPPGFKVSNGIASFRRSSPVAFPYRTEDR